MHAMYSRRDNKEGAVKAGVSACMWVELHLSGVAIALKEVLLRQSDLELQILQKEPPTEIYTMIGYGESRTRPY
jgi:hypothetical protein